jgi:hypothetical protein
MTIPLPVTARDVPAAGVASAAIEREVLLTALADASAYRRDRAAAYCLYCACERGGLCSDHARDLDAADDYDAVAEALAAAEDHGAPVRGDGWYEAGREPDEAADYDPGPECDDQGGMSEYRHVLPGADAEAVR